MVIRRGFAAATTAILLWASGASAAQPGFGPPRWNPKRPKLAGWRAVMTLDGRFNLTATLGAPGTVLASGSGSVKASGTASLKREALDPWMPARVVFSGPIRGSAAFDQQVDLAGKTTKQRGGCVGTLTGQDEGASYLSVTLDLDEGTFHWEMAGVVKGCTDPQLTVATQRVEAEADSAGFTAGAAKPSTIPESGTGLRSSGPAYVTGGQMLPLTGRGNMFLRLGDAGEEELKLVAVAPGAYDEWLPLPRKEDTGGIVFGEARPLEVKARIVPKRKGDSATPSHIDFYLQDVSEHRGLCNNYPPNGSEGRDLKFAEDQEDGIVRDGPDHAYTKEPVTEAIVRVESYDTAAYGKLRAHADSIELDGEYEPTRKRYFTIPRDDDENEIADAWEKPLVGSGQGGETDKDETPGGAKRGDGMSLAHEYRGYVVLDGGKPAFKRMDPRVKELFVLDDAGVFDTDLWKKAIGGSIAYRLADSMARQGKDPYVARDVDMNADGNHKYAPQLRVVGDAETGICSPSVFGCGDISASPKDAEYTKVFRSRIEKDKTILWLRNALTRPESTAAKWVAKNGFSTDVLKRAYAFLDTPAGKKQFVDAYVRVLAVHEVLHNCNVAGHWVGKSEAPVGVRSCPMRYPGTVGDLPDSEFADTATSLANGDLSFGYGALCSGGGFDCAGRLNLKDE